MKKLKIVVMNPLDDAKKKQLVEEIKEFIQTNYYS